MRPEIAPPEGQAWYKTTVEAYLRHEGDERLSVLGKLAPSPFGAHARQQTEARPTGHRETNRRKEQDSASKRVSPHFAATGRRSSRRAGHGAAFPAWRITGEAVILSGATRGIQTTPCLDPAHAANSAAAISDHIARWVAAMNAWKAKLHCTEIAMATGAPCRRVPLKFADKCSIHCRGVIKIDQLRLVWLQRKLRRSFFNVRERAALEAQVSKIKRRALALVVEDRPDAFRLDDRPREPRPCACFCAWLRDVAQVEPDTLTPRAFDQCLWAAALVLSRRYDEETALLKVKRALQVEELWRSKTGQAP